MSVSTTNCHFLCYAHWLVGLPGKVSYSEQGAQVDTVGKTLVLLLTRYSYHLGYRGKAEHLQKGQGLYERRLGNSLQWR